MCHTVTVLFHIYFLYFLYWSVSIIMPSGEWIWNKCMDICCTHQETCKVISDSCSITVALSHRCLSWWFASQHLYICCVEMVLNSCRVTLSGEHLWVSWYLPIVSHCWLTRVVAALVVGSVPLNSTTILSFRDSWIWCRIPSKDSLSSKVCCVTYVLSYWRDYTVLSGTLNLAQPSAIQRIEHCFDAEY